MLFVFDQKYFEFFRRKLPLFSNLLSYLFEQDFSLFCSVTLTINLRLLKILRYRQCKVAEPGESYIKKLGKLRRRGYPVVKLAGYPPSHYKALHPPSNFC